MVKLLYHYTTLENLFKIVNHGFTNMNNSLNFRCTHIDYLNDPTDNRIYIDYLKKSFISSPLNIKYKLSENFTEMEHCFESFKNVLSFSSHPNKLEMWRAYGKDGGGISIGVDLNQLDAFDCIDTLKITQHECIYDNKTILQECENFWKDSQNYIINDGIVSLNYRHPSNLEKMSIRFKHACYSYEKEVRLSILDLIKDKFYIKNGLIIPYCDIFIYKKYIKEIWLGPCLDFQRNTVALKAYLQNQDMEHVTIKHSDLPYRNN